MPGIIVGVDGSDHAHRALEWAVREAVIHQAPLTVLTVTHRVARHWDDPDRHPGDDDLIGQALKTAQEETDGALEKAGPGSRPASVTVQAVNGLPGEALLAAAEGADMLVVGSRGTGGFKCLRLGSVGVQVTHYAHCPVVVIPAESI